jgi:curved DNA-binding protein CbpA
MPDRDDLVACYQILGLAPGASREAVRKAYRQLVRSWHPDQFMHDEAQRRTAERQLAVINVAYRTLNQFLSFRAPFRFETSPTPPRDSPRGRGARRESALSRHRRRARAWWQSVRFSFVDFSTDWSPRAFVKTMSYGVLAWLVFLASITGFEALPDGTRMFLANDVGFFVHWSVYFGAILYVGVGRR